MGPIRGDKSIIIEWGGICDIHQSQYGAIFPVSI